MRTVLRIRSLARNIAITPAALLAATLLLTSPVIALGQNSQGNQNGGWVTVGSGNQDSQGNQNNQDGGSWVRGCVSSPENPSVLLAALGALGAYVIPKVREKLARKRGVADSD